MDRKKAPEDCVYRLTVRERIHDQTDVASSGRTMEVIV